MNQKKIQETNEKIAGGVVSGYQKIESGVVEGYKKMEQGAVDGYKKVEAGAVTGFQKVMDFFIRKLFTRQGETLQETKARLKGQK